MKISTLFYIDREKSNITYINHFRWPGYNLKNTHVYGRVSPKRLKSLPDRENSNDLTTTTPNPNINHSFFLMFLSLFFQISRDVILYILL